MEVESLTVALTKPRWTLSNQSIDIIAILIKEYCGYYHGKILVMEVICDEPDLDRESVEIFYHDKLKRMLLNYQGKYHIRYNNAPMRNFVTFNFKIDSTKAIYWEYLSIPYLTIKDKFATSINKTHFMSAIKNSKVLSRTIFSVKPKKISMLFLNKLNKSPQDLVLHSSKINKDFRRFNPMMNSFYIKIWRQRGKILLAEYQFDDKLLYVHIVKNVNESKLDINYKKSHKFYIRPTFKDKYGQKLSKWCDESKSVRLIKLTNGTIELWRFDASNEKNKVIHCYKSIKDIKDKKNKIHYRKINLDIDKQNALFTNIQTYLIKYINDEMYVVFCSETCYGIIKIDALNNNGKLITYHSIATLEKSLQVSRDLSSFEIIKVENDDGMHRKIKVTESELHERRYNSHLSDDNCKIMCISADSMAYRFEVTWKAPYSWDKPLNGYRFYYECIWIDVDALFY